MKSIKELLEMLLKNINSGKFRTCLCMSVFLLNNDVTKEELALLFDYINQNKPKSRFSIGIYNFLYYKDDSFYWKIGKVKPRIEWLKYHIKKNS